MWLDAKKTRNENAPIKMMHRAYDYLLASETLNGAANNGLVKDPKFKQVKLDGKVIGFAIGPTWSWTDAAK